jgi:hypothetical protein
MPDDPAAILMVDIDGVISLFGFDFASPPPGEFRTIDGIVHFLSAAAGPILVRLAERYELVWCSGWEEKANDYLPAFLGLPGPLPFLHFDRAVGRAHAHWKLAAIDAYAGPSRPLAWIDDALDQECDRWAAARTGPTLLVRTDPRAGLTAVQNAELSGWSGAAFGGISSS